jgi:phosphohistidine phosphatase SixA
MKIFQAAILALVALTFHSCKDDDVAAEPTDLQITSEEFIDDLLFVKSDSFQIKTNQPAKFSSSDPFIRMSSTGMISRLTSAEVVAIQVVAQNDTSLRRTIYALGVKDDNFDKPNVDFNGLVATEPYDSYVKGWKTLQKLPVEGETFGLVVRHADADNGRDWPIIHPGVEAPANWWKSCDSALARQLNDKGRQRATELGQIFKDLHFPIARVFSSEFCRARETASLINAGPNIITDGRLNHMAYNISNLGGVFPGIIQLMNEQPVDNKMTMFTTHHPANELGTSSMATFPNVIPFAWTGSYFIKITPDKTITFEGAVSYGMFKYWRDKNSGNL